MLKLIIVALLSCAIALGGFAQTPQDGCEEIVESTQEVMECPDPLFTNICSAIEAKLDVYKKSPRMNREQIESVASEIMWGWETYGIPPSLTLAIMEQESSFNYKVVSKHGAVGLMQVVPKYSKRAIRMLELKGDARKLLLTPHLNVRIALTMLYNFQGATKSYKDTTYNKVLTAYNMGEVAANRFYRNHKLTVQSSYSSKIHKKRRWFVERGIV